MFQHYIICDLNGKLINRSSQLIFGTRGLEKSLLSVKQFFNLSKGDVVILNDPHSGGYFPFGFTFIIKRSDSYFVGLLKFPLINPPHSSIDQEGLRIPPTPLRLNKVIQDRILQALKLHPMFPPRFENTLLKILSQKELYEDLLISKENYAAFKWSKTVEDFPDDDDECEVLIQKDMILKIFAKISPGQITLDFSGSTPGTQYKLPFHILEGTCQQFVNQFFDWPNTGVVPYDQFMKFSISQNSFFDYKGSAGITASYLKTIPALLHGLQKLFCGFFPKDHYPFHNFFQPWFYFEGKNEKLFFYLPNGTGSNGSEGGISSFSFDGISEVPEWREINKLFEVKDISPKQIKSSSKNKPGSGLCFKLIAKEDLTCFSQTEIESQNLKTLKGYSSIEPGGFKIGSSKVSNDFVKNTISKGTEIYFYSGHGAVLIK